MNAEIIPDSPALDVRNLGHLPRGTGAPYLEVIKGPIEDGRQVFIAKQWRRKPVKGSTVISFKKGGK